MNSLSIFNRLNGLICRPSGAYLSWFHNVIYSSFWFI